MQLKLEKGPLLNKDGNLIYPGYANSLVKTYNRSAIKSKKTRIKEYDYYYVSNSKYGVALTIADYSYFGLCSLTLLDFKKKQEVTKKVTQLFTFGKLKLPSTSETGNTHFSSKNVSMDIIHENGKRHLMCSIKKFSDKKDLRLDLYLEETNEDSIVVASPFSKPNHFFYNQKINLLKCNGYVKVGEEILDFNEDTFGMLDWGRGVWTYKNTWYLASMSGTYEGKRIGFNLGYGIGNTKTHSENIFFYEDKSYKLEDVHFDIPIGKHGSDSFMEPWKFRSSSGDINIIFKPIMNRHVNKNYLVVQSKENQVFGTFSGYVLVDGKEYYFADILGFAEKMKKEW